MNDGMEPISITRGEYEISTDRNRLNLAMIHGFLTTSYWAAGVTVGVVKRSIDHSLCFGLYHNGTQVGFGRVITDFATTAYVADIFVIEAERGKGLGDWLVETIINHPDLDGLRLWFLGTRDAHGLYEKHGFKKVAGTGIMERLMAILDPDVYKKK